MSSERKRLLIELFIFLFIFGALLGILVSRLQHRESAGAEHIQDAAALQNAWYAAAEEGGILGWDIQGTDGDRDEDGIPDGPDIYAAAKAYVATKPTYESRYYARGYPDDGYGVCSDVIAFSFLQAGFDLQTLVERDIREHPDAYDVEEADPKIDFRRVRNLQVYLSRHAESLTTDPDDHAAWEAGDVVVFDGHIGIISEKKTLGGRPHVLHHANPLQRDYEQDILKTREIIGHYRMG